MVEPVLIALVLALQSPSAAGSAPPTPAAVAAYQPARGDEREFWRYFFFWRRGVAPDAARADLMECAGYAGDPVLWARIPERMPLEGGVRGPNGTEGQFGLAGTIIFSLVEGGLVRRVALANLRRCMGFKGYRRYGLSSELWRSLHQGEAEQIMERLTAVAAGPEPQQASIAP